MSQAELLGSELGFTVDEAGPDGLFGVFEDEGETGFLYIYEPDGQGILKHLQIYDCAEILNVKEEDVEVLWSTDGSKCGVKIWGGMRGIIDLSRNVEGRVKLESRDTPSIGDTDWLQGFYVDAPDF